MHSLAPIIVGAINIVKSDDVIDINMVEILRMQHQDIEGTSLIRGIVFDHGGRHPGMPTKLSDCYILNLNVSLEYEKTYLKR